jgi:hypothetical protein
MLAMPTPTILKAAGKPLRCLAQLQAQNHSRIGSNPQPMMPKSISSKFE